MLEVLRRLRGFCEQTAKVHAKRAIGVDQPDRRLRQRQRKSEGKTCRKTHRAVHVEGVLTLGNRPPLVRRHAERANRDRLTTMLCYRLDRFTRLHALSPLTSLRVRNSTNGRF